MNEVAKPPERIWLQFYADDEMFETDREAWYEYRPDGRHVCLGCGQAHDWSQPRNWQGQHKEGCWVQRESDELVRRIRARAEVE